MKDNRKTKRHYTNFEKVIIVIATLLGIIFTIAALGSFWINYSFQNSYYDKWDECGQPPIQILESESSSKYAKFGDDYYSSPGFFLQYVCTEQEAIDHGAEHGQY